MKKSLLVFIILFFIYNTTNAGFNITNIPSDFYSQNIWWGDYVTIDNVWVGNGVYWFYSKPYMAWIYNINGLSCSTDTNFYINMADPTHIKWCYEWDLEIIWQIKIVRTTDSATVYASDFDIMLDPTPPTPPVSTWSLTNSINNLTNNSITNTNSLLGWSVWTVIATLLALIILTFIVLYVRNLYKKP